MLQNNIFDCSDFATHVVIFKLTKFFLFNKIYYSSFNKSFLTVLVLKITIF